MERKLVGGVSLNKGGRSHPSLPVFNTVREAVEKTEGQQRQSFMCQHHFVKDAIIEAIDAEIQVNCL